MDPRTRRSPARWLAPLALIAVVVAFAAIVSGSGGSGQSALDTTTRTSQRTTVKQTQKKAKPRTAKANSGGSRFYTVQIGDSLSAISTKTGVPLAKIQELNPDVDSTQMTAGQKIRVK